MSKRSSCANQGDYKNLWMGTSWLIEVSAEMAYHASWFQIHLIVNDLFGKINLWFWPTKSTDFRRSCSEVLETIHVGWILPNIYIVQMICLRSLWSSPVELSNLLFSMKRSLWRNGWVRSVNIQMKRPTAIAS